MPIRNIHEEPFDEGTQAKLNIFSAYLEAWLPTFIHSPRCDEVNIIDFFAGSGCDSEGCPGSPLLAIKIIAGYMGRIREHGLKVNLILNEYDKKKYSQLCECVTAELERLALNNRYFDVKVMREDFQKLFPKVSAALKEHCNLFFLDQNGLKHIGRQRLLELDQFVRTDYLLFTSSSFLVRFDFEGFNGFSLPEEARITDVHRYVLEWYRAQLPEDSATRLYPFTIKKRTASQVYGLIFGTKHIFGADKFLNIAWGQNPLNGEANFDIDDDLPPPQTQLTFDFEKTKVTKVDKFKGVIRRFILSSKTVTNEELLEFSIDHGFIPKFANEVVRQMRGEGIIEHFSHSKIGYIPAKRNHDIVTFKVK